MVFWIKTIKVLELDSFYYQKVSAYLIHRNIFLLPLHFSFSKNLHKATILYKNQHSQTNTQFTEGIVK